MRFISELGIRLLGFAIGLAISSCCMLLADVFKSPEPQSLTQACHKYKSLGGGGGHAPQEGSDECAPAGGQMWQCADGARIYSVWSKCGSFRAAQLQAKARLTLSSPWTGAPKLLTVRELHQGTLVEFAEPVAPPGQSVARCRWMFVWTQSRGICVLYAHDYEHLEDRLTFYGIDLNDGAVGAGA